MAKPQQMSTQPDNSDDLIAELAKLMATNAKGDTSGAKAAPPAPSTPSPAVAALAGSTAKPSVRIPGLDMPPLNIVPIDTTAKSDSKPAAFEYKPMAPPASQTKPGTTVPTIRIPGMDQPVASAAPKPVAPAVMSPAIPSASKPVSSAPEIKRAEIKPASATSSPVMPLRPAASDGKTGAPVRIEPKIVAAPVNPPPGEIKAAAKDDAKRSTAAADDFDFGFGTNDKAKDQAKDGPKTSYDPIADLIAADAAGGSKPEATTKPVQVGASAPKPATVTPIVPNAGSKTPPPVSAQPAAKLTPAAPLTLKPAFGAKPAAAENDKFFVAPVFGIGNKTTPPVTLPAAEVKPVVVAAPQAAKERRPGDPMDEIEDLIGEAVRVDMESADASIDQPEPSKPVVPPLTTNFAPRRSGLKDERDAGPKSADDAIMAAMAVSGGEVGRVEPVVGEEPSRKKSKYKPKPSRRPPVGGARQYVGLAVAGTLLLAAGFGLYWVLNMGRGDPANAPLLTADGSPTKQTPAVIASTEPSSPVLDQIGGVTTGEPEVLVSRDDTVGETVTQVASIPEVTESGLANRKVRTVTVRPDGTIVSSDNSVAGAEALPVERPDVPDVPGEPIAPSELLTAAADDATADPIADMISETEAPGGAELTAQAPADANTAADAVTVATAEPTPEPTTALALLPPGATETPANVVAPVPVPRPLNRNSLNGAPSESVTAAVDPGNGLALTAGGQQIDLLAPQQNEPEPAAVAVATPAPPAAGNAAAYIQISSQPSEDAARSTARDLTNRFGSLFGGGTAEIHRADLGARGIWYRVRVPANSRASANSICADIKSAGGDCIVP